MSNPGVENKINIYIRQTPHLKGVPKERIVSIMLEEGKLTADEARSWYKNLEADTKTNTSKTASTPSISETLPAAQNSSAKTIFTNEIKTEKTAGITLEKQSQTQKPAQISHTFTTESPSIDLTETEAQNEVINTIMEDVSKSYILYQKQDNGIITKGYDALKNHFDSDMSSSNVEEALALQSEGADNLMLARDGKLSKREYYLENREHLKKMLTRRLYEKDEQSGLDFLDRNKGSKSKEEFAEFFDKFIDNMLDKIPSIESLKKSIHELVTSNPEQTEENLQKLLKRAENHQNREIPVENNGLNIKGSGIPPEFDSDEPISFEEVYRYERGVEFDKERIEQTIQKGKELTFAASVYKKYTDFKNSADKIINADSTPDKKSKQIIELYNEYYAVSSNETEVKKHLNETIKKGNLPVTIKEENGEITLDLSAYKTEDEKNKALNMLLRFGIKEQKERAAKLLGGNPEEKMLAISQDYETVYNNAYGNEFTEELVQAMANDNDTVIQRYTGGTSLSGMAVTVIGGVLCLTPAAPLGTAMIVSGNTMAIGGLLAESGLGYTEALTRDEISDEEIGKLTKNLIVNAGGFVIGFVAGKAGVKAFNKLIDKKLVETLKIQITNGNRTQALKQVFSDSDKLANFMKAAGAKLGSDFLLSYAGDLAMAKAFDTKDDWQSLLKANLMGVIVATSSDVSDIGKLAMRKDTHRKSSKKSEDHSPTVAEYLEKKQTAANDAENTAGMNSAGKTEPSNIKTFDELKEGMLSLKTNDGYGLQEEFLTGALSKYNEKEIKSLIKIYNKLQNDKFIYDDDVIYTLSNILSADKNNLPLFEKIILAESEKDSFQLIDARIPADNRIQPMSADLKVVESLMELQKTNNNPVLNIDNIIVLARNYDEKDIDNLTKLLNAKAKDGKFIANARLLNCITSIDFYSSKDKYSLNDFIKADGKLDSGVIEYFEKYPNLSGILTEEIKNNPSLTVKDFEAKLQNKYNQIIDSFDFKDETFKLSLQKITKDMPDPVMIKLQGKRLLQVEEDCLKIEDENLRNLTVQSLINNELTSIKVEDVIGVYNTFNGKYNYIGDKYDMPRFREYYKFLLQSNPEKAKKFAAAIQDGNIKLDDKDFVDFINEAKIDRLRAFVQQNPESRLCNYFYNEYYLNQSHIPPDLKAKCEKINEKYGTKVFLSSDSEIEALEYLDAELAEWKKISGGEANFPAVFDFSKAKRNYIDDTSAHGQSRAIGYQNDYERTIALDGLNYDNMAYAIRHELTHANDLKKGVNIDPKYNLDEIMPHDANGKPIYEKCLFKDEFRNAGIPEMHIPYAYNNTNEFIAVAAEGDMSKYSPEFKQMLLDFGMPEWQLKMKDFSYWDKHKIHDFNTICHQNGDSYQITPEGKKILNEHVKGIRNQALAVEDEIVKFMYDMKLGTPATLTHRTKGESSLFDKLANYFKEKADKTPSIKDAVDSVKDAIGVRTLLKSSNYTNHPDVQRLLKAGDEHGAMLRAAELQSQPMVDNIKEMITKYAKGEIDTKITRINNYMGKDGIPYFSERQLEEIQRHAANNNIYDFSIVTRIDEDDAHYSSSEIKENNKKSTTKVRDSGYTALQMNFETKDGQVFEWQLRGDKVNVFGEAEHVPYDLRTGKDISSGNPELAEFYAPIKELLSEENMSAEDFNDYNNYLTDYYLHLRKLELGFESSEPVLPDKFDIRLKAQNLELLHDFAEQVKKGKKSGYLAKNELERKIYSDSNRAKTQILEGGTRADELDEIYPYDYPDSNL